MQIFKRNSLSNILNMTQSKFLINNGILLRLEKAKKNLTNQKNELN